MVDENVNIIQHELVHLPVNYCETTQTEIRPEMRRIVTDWMFDVRSELQVPEKFSETFHGNFSSADLML